MLLIKNGRVIDPASNADATQDVLLDKGVVAKVGAIFLRMVRRCSTRLD